MKTFFLFLLVYIMGFLTAIPIGATQIEIAKRSLNNQIPAALMVVLGSVFSDVMYGFIALFGVAPFLQTQIVIAVFELVGVVILWILAFLTFKEVFKPHIMDITSSVLKSRWLSFITGFSLAITNPMMIFWWLIGVQVVKDLGLVGTFTLAISISFLFFNLSFPLFLFIRGSSVLHRCYISFETFEDDFPHRLLLQGRLDLAPQFYVDVSEYVVHIFTPSHLEYFYTKIER